MTIAEMYDWLYRIKSEILVFMPKEWHEPMRESIQDVITFSRKYQMMQADYNARLKADMVAMLTDIQLEIEEIPNSYEHKPIGTYDYCLGAEHERKVNLEIIQQEIDKLKEVEE